MNSAKRFRASLSCRVAMRPKSAKAALDDISAFVGALVDAMEDDTVGFAGGYRLGVVPYDFGAKVVTVVPLVGEKRAHGWCEHQNIGRSSGVGILTWAHMQDDRSAKRIAKRMVIVSHFPAGGTPVSFDRGRVERRHDSIFARLGQRFKDGAPSSARGPTIETIVDRRVGTVFTRTIAPSLIRSQHENDPPSIVFPPWPCQPGRQIGSDTRPLPITQPKQTAQHSLARPNNTQARESRSTI
jgi:hypothetical protein